MPIVAAKNAVSVPMIATTVSAIGARSKITCERETMYTPAVTIVAAWIKAETGVGPSIASGSQMYKRNLRRLAARAHHQQNSNRRQQPGAGRFRRTSADTLRNT